MYSRLLNLEENLGWIYPGPVSCEKQENCNWTGSIVDYIGFACKKSSVKSWDLTHPDSSRAR